MILGLTAIAAFSSKGQFIKAMMMVILGLMLLQLVKIVYLTLQDLHLII